MEPATMAAIGLALSAASAAATTYGTYRQVEAQNQAAEYNAQIAETNAQIARMQADDAVSRGRQQERRQRQDVLRFAGLQKTKLAAAGVDIDAGSALDVLESSAFEGQMDALALRHNAAREAWGYRVQGADYQAQSRLQRMQKRSAAFAAGTTLLTKAPGVYERYRTYRQRT